MEIVLREKDIEKILKKQYRDIKEIKFSGKNPKITMIIDDFEQVEPKPVVKNDVKAVSVESPPRKKPEGNVMGTERRIMEL